jgi:hypothetical protein
MEGSMGRRGSKLVDKVVRQDFGIEIEIRLDTQNAEFSAHVFDTLLRDTNLSNLRAKISEEIDCYMDSNLEWKGVIKVTEQSPFHGYGPFVGFEFERFYVASRSDGKWLQTPWDVDARYRIINARVFRTEEEFKLPCEEEQWENKVFYLPYDERAWTGLKALSKAIGEIKGKLRQLLGTPNGNKTLLEAGSRLMLTLTADGSEREDNGERDTEGSEAV